MPVLVIMLGYLAGSVPSAYIAGRLIKGLDIRQVGDRNMGAANAYQEIKGPKLTCLFSSIYCGFIVDYLR